MRDSRPLAIAAPQRQAGAAWAGYDPALCSHDLRVDAVDVVGDTCRATAGAGALVVLTEWPEFRMLDWPRMAELTRRPVVDTRKLLDPDVVRGAALGRG